MKICFLTEDIFTLGGIQRVVSVLANELNKYHSVDILCISTRSEIDRNLYNLDKKINVELNLELIKKNFFNKVYCKIVNKINSKTGVLNNRKVTKLLSKAYWPKELQDKFIKYFNSNDYDVIIGVNGSYSLLLGIIANKLNAKTIGWQHNSYDAYFNTKNQYYWNQDELYKLFIKRLDKYIVLTDEDKKIIDRKFNISSSRIYNPLSFSSDKKSTCEEKKIICVGRLVQKQKGLDLLIKAFNKALLNYTDWKLYIVGDGPDKEKLRKLIMNLKIEDSVEIKSFTNNIKEYYLNSSILVSSSRWEGFGLVITEAMECGLPVIAFANSGPKEIITKPNENGILVQCEDIDALAENIIDLMKNKEKRKRIARESIVRAQDFSIGKTYEEWNEMLQSLKN